MKHDFCNILKYILHILHILCMRNQNMNLYAICVIVYCIYIYICILYVIAIVYIAIDHISIRII